MQTGSATPAPSPPWPVFFETPRALAGRVATTTTPEPALHARAGLSHRALARAYAYIDAHLGERISLAELAAAAAVSRFHFARMFRVSTGTSPMDFLQRVRIEVAKAWLDAGRQRVADIAATLGYCDQSHFTRTFRRHTGVSPRDYLQRHRAIPSPPNTGGSP